MATQAIKFTKSKFGRRFDYDGNYEAVIREVNKGCKTVDDVKQPLLDKQGNQVWFVNFDLKNHRNRTIQNRWSEADNTVLAFAIFTANALDACGIDYDESELSTDFDGLVKIWETKGLIGKEVRIKVSHERGSKNTDANLLKVDFI